MLSQIFIFVLIATASSLSFNKKTLDKPFKLNELFKFTQIEYSNLPKSENFPYIQYNNVPQGFAPFISRNNETKSKMFIAVPRRSPGVPSTLNYVELKDNQESYVNPELQSYPSYEINELESIDQELMNVTDFGLLILG